MLRYTLYEIRRSVLSPSSVFYTIILPVGLYMLFGALQDYAKVKVADGNASAYVMIGMALYGAISSTVSISGLTVVENTAGWGRQLALTPLSTGKYLFSKAAVAFVMAALPVVAVNIAGRLTGIEMPISQQILCAALSIFCALIFAFMGLAVGLLIPSENAVSIANGVIVIFAFFGTLFAPLTKDLMPYARFTPLYGAAEIARYPFAQGLTIISGSGAEWNMTEPLWYGVVSFAAWGALFILATMLLMRRTTRR